MCACVRAHACTRAIVLVLSPLFCVCVCALVHGCEGVCACAEAPVEVEGSLGVSLAPCFLLCCVPRLSGLRLHPVSP